MKNKSFIYILIALILIAGFLYLRNSSTDGDSGNSSDSLIPSTVSEISDGGENGSEAAEPAEAAQGGVDTAPADNEPDAGEPAPAEETVIDKDGVYDSKEEVALYIHTYGTLPSNYISKEEAMKAGWSGNGGDKLEKYCPGKCIGGSWFGNYEGKLPKAKGRTWAECDIDTLGAKNRGVKRIIFSNDGLIYYTEDHYETFELLYGEP
ncbi:MAG: ribonuclease [Oscillospiraceae bacterium]|nr:ribonuclease [Oscillospiraceae bacterium]